jgi:hypothetical protein
MIVHVPHAVTLETELGSKVEKDVLNLLLCARNLCFCGPCWVWLTGALASRERVRVVHAVDRRGGTRRSVPTIRDLGGRWSVSTVRAIAVAVISLIATSVVIHVGRTSHVGTHCEVAKGLRVFLGVLSTTAGLTSVAFLGTSLVIILIIIIFILVALLVAVVIIAVLLLMLAVIVGGFIVVSIALLLVLTLSLAMGVVVVLPVLLVVVVVPVLCLIVLGVLALGLILAVAVIVLASLRMSGHLGE